MLKGIQGVHDRDISASWWKMTVSSFNSPLYVLKGQMVIYPWSLYIATGHLAPPC